MGCGNNAITGHYACTVCGFKVFTKKSNFKAHLIKEAWFSFLPTVGEISQTDVVGVEVKTLSSSNVQLGDNNVSPEHAEQCFKVFKSNYYNSLLYCVKQFRRYVFLDFL